VRNKQSSFEGDRSLQLVKNLSEYPLCIQRSIVLYDLIFSTLSSGQKYLKIFLE